MSKYATTSNAKSPLVNTANVPDKVMLPSYKIPFSTGVNFPDIIGIPCEGTAATGVSMVGKQFKTLVNMTGYWRLCLVRCDFRFTGTAPTAPLGYLGLTIADHEVRTLSGKLRSLRSEEILAALELMPNAVKSAILERALIYNTLSNFADSGTPLIGVDYHTYCPVIISSFESNRNNWDLDTLEPIQIISTVNETKKSGLFTAVVSGPTSTVPFTVYSITTNRPAEDKLKIYEMNFGSGEDMPYLSYDSDIQITNMLNTAYSFLENTDYSLTVKLDTRTPMFAMINYFRKAATIAGGNAGQSFIAKTTNVKLNQTFLYDEIPSIVSSYIKDFSGGNNSHNIVNNAGTYSAVVNTNKYHTISFNEKPLDRTSYSGTLALNNINNPELIFKFRVPTAAVDYEQVFVVYFHTELLMNGRSGQVYQSVAS